METIAAFASRTGPGDPNESFADYVERLKAKAAEPKVNELITTTYYRLWDEHKPESDEEQAAIEPMTVAVLEGQLAYKKTGNLRAVQLPLGHTILYPTRVGHAIVAL